jgi:hypothetical protein
MLIAQSPMNNTIETPTYNMASIMVFPLPTLRAWRLDLQEMAGIFTSMTNSLVVGSCLKT